MPRPTRDGQGGAAGVWADTLGAGGGHGAGSAVGHGAGVFGGGSCGGRGEDGPSATAARCSTGCSRLRVASWVRAARGCRPARLARGAADVSRSGCSAQGLRRGAHPGPGRRPRWGRPSTPRPAPPRATPPQARSPRRARVFVNTAGHWSSAASARSRERRKRLIAMAGTSGSHRSVLPIRDRQHGFSASRGRRAHPRRSPQARPRSRSTPITSSTRPSTSSALSCATAYMSRGDAWSMKTSGSTIER